MASQLGIYNGALRWLGARRLVALTDDSKSRRVCDDIWNDGFINDVLSDGFWKFAVRTAAVEYDAQASPPFGFTRAFTLPADLLRVRMVSGDEFFTTPLTQYAIEAGFIYALLDEIFLSYISNDSAYGGNLTAWTENFNRYCAAYLALQLTPSITVDKERQKLIEMETRKLLTEAQSQDAMDGPTKFTPMGTWSRSRQGRYGTWSDRGKPNQLIG